MGRKLKLKEDKIRFDKISKLCNGKVLHLGSSNIAEDYNLHNYLKEKNIDVVSVGLEEADIIQNLDESNWKIKSTYDTVIAPEIIEHVEHPSQFLRNASKLLKKGGTFILATPNASSVIYLKNPDWCVGKNCGVMHEDDNGHLHTFTSGMLRYLLEEVAEIKETKYEYLNGYLRNPIGYAIGAIFPRLRGDILIWGKK